MNFSSMGDNAILKELGRRIQSARLRLNMSQATLAQKAGISRLSLHHLESGKSCTLILWIRVLRVLGQVEPLDNLLPAPGPSPLELARLKGRERQRASRPRGPRAKEQG